MKYLLCLLISFFISCPVMAGEKTYGDLSGTVVSVHDGDTMTVSIPGVPPLLGNTIPIRVRGIDTPEMHDARPNIQVIAVQARDLVRGWCPVGSPVELHDVGRGKYFRIVATPICGDLDVAKELLKVGLAHVYDGGTKQPW